MCGQYSTQLSANDGTKLLYKHPVKVFPNKLLAKVPLDSFCSVCAFVCPPVVSIVHGCIAVVAAAIWLSHFFILVALLSTTLKFIIMAWH